MVVSLDELYLPIEQRHDTRDHFRLSQQFGLHMSSEEQVTALS